MIQRGKASNDDKTFGAVMKWLADNPFDELEDKYRLEVAEKFEETIRVNNIYNRH